MIEVSGHRRDGMTQKVERVAASDESREAQRPRGFTAIGAFFVFGATMVAYAAVTVLQPGTFLDALWALNRRGHAGLMVLGKSVALLFIVLSTLLAIAAAGWFRRRYWGWVLGVTIIAVNALGDLVNLTRGEGVKGAVGIVIAGLLLIYMTRTGVRRYFCEPARHRSVLN